MGFLSVPAALVTDEGSARLLTTVVYFQNMNAKATKNTPAAAARTMFVVLTDEAVDPLLLAVLPPLGGLAGVGQAGVLNQLLTELLCEHTGDDAHKVTASCNTLVLVTTQSSLYVTIYDTPPLSHV